MGRGTLPADPMLDAGDSDAGSTGRNRPEILRVQCVKHCSALPLLKSTRLADMRHESQSFGYCNPISGFVHVAWCSCVHVRQCELSEAHEDNKRSAPSYMDLTCSMVAWQMQRRQQTGTRKASPVRLSVHCLSSLS
jgi:hypothetical protein